VAQVVQCLLSKHKVLCPNPSLRKKIGCGDVLGRPKQEDLKFKVYLGFIANSRPASAT
jgi:hypothetical protein